MNVTITDAAGNQSTAYTSAITQDSDRIDANTPSISSVSIPDAAMNVGDTVTVTITVPSDTDDYTSGSGGISGTIGGFTVGTLSKTNNTTYSAQFTISNGGTDVEAGTDIPVSVQITDSSGNQSTAYTTAISQSNDPIDANKPVISNVTIPDAAMKVGDTVTVTITVPSDIDDYTSGSGGISGTVGVFSVSGLSRTNNTTYTAQFSVANGGTDVAAGTDIPVNVTITDSAGNAAASAYTTAISQGSDRLDANTPTISNVSIPNTQMKVGDTVTVTITVPSDTDDYTGGSGGLSGTVAGRTLSSFSRTNNTTYTAQFSISNGESDTAAGSDITVSIRITDSAGNQSNTYNTAISQANDGIDANVPTMSSLSPLDNATDIPTTANLSITFSENVVVDTGNIVIKKTSDNSTIATIDVTGGQVSGGGSTTITINPDNDLPGNTEMYVQIDATCFDDEGGNSYAGISTTTDWSFTTANAVPVIDLVETDPIVYTPGSGPVLVSENATVTDPDSANYNGGNLDIRYTSGGTSNDRLGISPQGDGSEQINVSGSTVSYEGNAFGIFGGGVGTTQLIITLNTTHATRLAVQALIRRVTYENVSDTPVQQTRTVRFRLTDEASQVSSDKTRDIQLAQPKANFSAATYSVAENVGNAVITVNLSSNAQNTSTIDYTTSDGTATAGSDYTSTGGTLTFNTGESSKTFSIPIIKDSEMEDAETINLTLSNPTGTLELGSQTTAVVTIIGNRAPVSSSQNLSTDEDYSLTISLTASDPDGDKISSYSITSQPSNGQITSLNSNTGDVTYSPNSNFNGSDSFTYTATDGQATSSAGTINITVNSINDPPSADSKSVSTNEDTAITVQLSNRDTDGDSLSFQITSNPSHGRLSKSGSSVTYTPTSGYSGQDSFSYVASDGARQSNTATVSITVIRTSPTNTPTPLPTNTPSNTPTQTPSNTPSSTPSPTATHTPSPTATHTPEVTDTPTPSPTETVTPTETASPTHTPSPTETPEPTLTPTNSPRPNNIPPQLIIDPGQNLHVKPGKIQKFSFTIIDLDGDTIKLTVSTGVPLTFQGESRIPPIFTFIDYKFQTAMEGEYSFIVTAYDGSATVDKLVTVTVGDTPPVLPTSTSTPEPTNTITPEPTSTPTLEPTDTPEPTNTPTTQPIPVEPTNTLPPVETNTPEPAATNTPEPEPTSTPTPEPTSTPQGPTPTPSPTPVPTPVVLVTDNASTGEDLSGGQDHDSLNNRAIGIQWEFNGTTIDFENMIDIHIWLKDNDNNFAYLGQTNDPRATSFEWKALGNGVAPGFKSGPQYGHSYRFRIYALLNETGENGLPINIGPFPGQGTAAVNMLPIVTVTDNLLSLADLSNGVDSDPANDTELVIRWNPDPNEVNINDIKNAHIYVYEGNNPTPVYLGRTTDESNFFVWNAENPFLSDAFKEQGPQIGESYRFRVYVFTKSGFPRFYGYYHNAGLVRMTAQ